MITNIRGMSGSGKSTAVRNIMERYPTLNVLLTDKKRPLLYKCSGLAEYNDLIVLGPYDQKNSVQGADSIDNNDRIRLLLTTYDDLGYDVLFEHFMLSGNVSFMLDLANEGRKVNVCRLDVPKAQVALQRQNRSIANGGTGQFSATSFKHDDSKILESFDKLSLEPNVNTMVITQTDAVTKYYQMVKPAVVNNIVDNTDLWELKCKYKNLKGEKKQSRLDKISLGDLFE